MVGRKVIRVAGMGQRGPLPGKRKKVIGWVRREISLGRLKPGETLPSRMWFCSRFKLAPGSVQLAFDELMEDGLIVAVPGHGTRVSSEIPFHGRYLLLLMSSDDNAGSKMFAPALKQAADMVGRKRSVTFEIRELMDAPDDSVQYAEMLSDVRKMKYAGVFAQGLTEFGHGMDTVTNIDAVPMAFFGKASALAQGSKVVPLPISDDSWRKELYRRMFSDMKKQGVHRVAVFLPDNDGYNNLVRMREWASECGLVIVEDGFHCVEVNHWSPRQVSRLLRLFLRSDVGRDAEGILLGDDNFLPLFADACRSVLGCAGRNRYRIVSHCNFPHLPDVDFPCSFHGPDLEKTISSFLDYADDCHLGLKHPRLPMLMFK